MLSQTLKRFLSFFVFAVVATALGLLFAFYKKGFIFTLLSLMPISELRGSIPFAVFSSFHCPLWIATPLAIALNWLIAPLVFLFFDHIHPLFCKCNAYRNKVDSFLNRAQKKMKPTIDKYGVWGIMLFIGIPLPATGVYTGVTAAWFLGLSRKKTLLAALGGTLLAGCIVTLIVLLIQYGLLSEKAEAVLSHFLKVFKTTDSL